MSSTVDTTAPYMDVELEYGEHSYVNIGVGLGHMRNHGQLVSTHMYTINKEVLT